MYSSRDGLAMPHVLKYLLPVGVVFQVECSSDTLGERPRALFTLHESRRGHSEAGGLSVGLLGPPKSTLGHPKSIPEPPKSRFGVSLGSKMYPKSMSEQPGGTQERPGSAQEAPKERPRGPRAAQERPRAGRVVPKPSQNGAQNQKILMLNSKSF